MTSHHGRILVPLLKICDWLIVYACEGESRCFRIDLHLVSNFEKLILYKLLVFNNTNHKRLDDIEGCLRVGMRQLPVFVYQRVAAQEEL